MAATNCTVGYAPIDTTNSICAIHNSGAAVNNLQKCCGNAPVQTTPDGCLKYCQYDSSRLSEFTSCLGDGIVGAVCQASKGTSNPTASSSPTSTSSTTAPTASSSAPRAYGWFRSAMAVMMVVMVGSSLATDVIPGQNIFSCADGQCKKCDIGNNPGRPHNGEFNVQHGYPECEIYSSVQFKGAESKTGGGYDVWWNIGQPNAGCQIIIMSPVGEDVSGSNCGNIVLAEKRAGCYYTHLEETFMVQFCCGSGDCSKAGVQGLRRRDVSEIPELIARAAAGGLGDDTFAVPLSMPNGSEPIASFSLEAKRSRYASHSIGTTSGSSLTGRAGRYAAAELGRRRHKKETPPPAPPKPTCSNVQNKGDSYTKAGPQTQVSKVLVCNSETPCNQQVGSQISVAHTLTNTHSTTITNSGGVSVAIEAGVDFIVESKVTATAHYEYAKAVEDATGTQDSTSKTTTLNQVYAQVPGTTGYIWFTPRLNCQRKTMTCDGQDIEVEQCDPDLLGDGTQNGEFGFTTTA